MIPNNSIPAFKLKMRISSGMPKVELEGYFLQTFKNDRVRNYFCLSRCLGILSIASAYKGVALPLSTLNHSCDFYLEILFKNFADLTEFVQNIQKGKI